MARGGRVRRESRDRMVAPRPRCRPGLWWSLIAILAFPATAGDPRDIVFDCPCSAEWTESRPGEPGQLTLTFGVRSFRATESGEVRLTPSQRSEDGTYYFLPGAPIGDPKWPSVGSVRAGAAFGGWRRTMDLNRPAPGRAIAVVLWEKVAESPAGPSWMRRETLALWPMVDDAGTDRIEYLDLLTDTDGDGIGDVNERLAGTSWEDPASTPGTSTIDVLALYNAGFRDAQGGYPYTRIHHVMVLTNALYVDSGTNLRLRTVGMSEVALQASGLPSPEEYEELQERHGADVSMRFHTGPNWSCPAYAAGCAGLGGAGRRGDWWGETVPAATMGHARATTPAHELGHVLGLLHSTRQGEALGAFRWSRGHYLDDQTGTIMAYGLRILGGVFSDPAADCVTGPCGVPVDKAGGAHAVKSLDLVRFQVARNRSAKPDTDGDGIVDPADAFPDDPDDWVDLDGDGVGDVADPDDDNDGVADTDDPFPFDPTEWEDADQDGIGDNADDEVTDLSPFRDPALRTAVEQALGKEAGAPITEEDLLALTTLEAPSQQIRDLTGLELATNLEKLDLLGNEVADVSPLRDLPRLSDLGLGGNRVADLTPLSSMVGLRNLWLTDNPISDLSPLRQLRQLQSLFVGGADHGISDVSLLGELTNLRSLQAANLGIVDLSLLSGLTQLTSLSIPNNPVADLSPLRDMTRLWSLDVSGTAVSDLSPLSDLQLWSLFIDRTALSLDDVLGLPRSRQLRSLGIAALGLEDISALSEFVELESLNLMDNRVQDLSPLGGLARLRWLHLADNNVSDIGGISGLSALSTLDLRGNELSDIAPLGSLSRLSWLVLLNNDVSDIRPLVRREIWDLDTGVANLYLYRNPLDDAARRRHIPTLESWGIQVHASEPTAESPGVVVAIADPVLRALVAQARARWTVRVDDPITEESLENLTHLHAFNAGVSNLTGLDAAKGLGDVFLGSNLISELGPLAALEKLEGLDLSDNLVSDLSPLVDNPHVDAGDWITLTGNPLSEASLNVHVPALRERGVHVGVDSVRLLVPPDTRAANFEVSGYFDATLSTGVQTTAGSDDPDGLQADIVDGELRVALADAEGSTTVTVTGTGDDGTTETLAFHVSLRQVIALFPSAASPLYQGFVRVINHSPRAGRVVIHATDDEGLHYDPVTLSMDADQTVHFNSQDLEHGNPAKGLADGIGAGAGDWRLDLGSNLDIEALGYARTADGFVTALHDLAHATGPDRAIAIFNPGSNTAQVSLLRLVNHGDESVEVTVRGVDDQGQSPGRDVLLTLPPGTARAPTAADLESGAEATGALGDGSGKWRLTVESTAPVYAMSLLESPTGHLTNLSSGPVTPVGVAHSVPLFPSAADPDGREGFVRVVNREARAGSVTITAVDDAGQGHGAVALALGAGQTVHFNSDDLERGNAAKGLSGGVGAGSGNWRLALTGDVEIDVLGYIRHVDGFLTSMHDAAPVTDTRHRIAFFNPGSNRAQVSSLRLINPGATPASVTITGRDDSGASSGGPVQVTLPAGAARTYTAEQLEESGADLRGELGDGAGKWRLLVESTRPISAMSLLASPTGHLTNLSTAPMR